MSWLFPIGLDRENRSVDWPLLLEQFEWLRALDGCPQDPIYHAEGDVLIHTRMVCEALLAEEAWADLSAEGQSILFAAALLHDVAKPSCTEIKEGRVSSPNHAWKGAKMAQGILYQGWPSTLPPVPFSVRQQIVGLVRYHGLPLWFLERPSPERAVIEASMRATCGWVALLAKADVLGRECHENQELLERVALFHDFCQEEQCFDGPRTFPSDHSRFLYFRKADRDPHYLAHDDTCCEVVVMSGLPGSGKDSWIDEQCQDWPIISLDQIRTELKISPNKNQGPVIVKAKELAREYLRQKQSFVWNATNVTRSMRQGLIDLFAAYHAQIRLVYIEVPWVDLLRQNRQRTSAIPEEAIYRLAGRLEVPDLAEAHQLFLKG